MGNSPTNHPFEKTEIETQASQWTSLYKIGAVSAILIAVLYLVEVIGVGLTGPPPTTVIGWFTLLNENRPLGLFKLFLIDIASTALLIPLFLALYASLRKVNNSLMLIATAVGLVGVTVYFSSNTSLSMLNLSNQYASATTDTQREILLAMGQPLLSMAQSTGVYIGFLFNCISLIIASVVMMYSKVFSKTIAWLGIVANVLLLLPGPPAEFVPQSWYTPLVAVFGVGGIILVAWYLLTANKLYRISKAKPTS